MKLTLDYQDCAFASESVSMRSFSIFHFQACSSYSFNVLNLYRVLYDVLVENFL